MNIWMYICVCICPRICIWPWICTCYSICCNKKYKLQHMAVTPHSLHWVRTVVGIFSQGSSAPSTLPKVTLHQFLLQLLKKCISVFVFTFEFVFEFVFVSQPYSRWPCCLFAPHFFNVIMYSCLCICICISTCWVFAPVF